ncbi:hypothetical protein GBB76_12105 [Ancylobacter sp. TS-1]|nr:hypothetical protein GBB76_12105 [Ancylobacter sp. TS-1]
MDSWQMMPTAQRILSKSLALRPDEVLTVITDTEVPRSVTETLACAATALGATPVILTMLPAPVGGMEPPAPIAHAMAGSQVMVFQTSAGMIHTEAARNAVKNGARFLDMWGVTESMMVRGGPTADFSEVGRVTNAVYDAIVGGAEIRVTTEKGTDFRLSMKDRPLFKFSGQATEPGSFSAMPEGEVTVCPEEWESEGVLVDPVVLERRDIAFPRQPIKVVVEKGRICAVEGGREAKAIAAMLDEHGETSRNIAEFAMGTNKWCPLAVTLRDSKKSYGSFHIGMGDNRSFGGNVLSPFHMDMIFENPTVTVDGRTVLENGKYTVI